MGSVFSRLGSSIFVATILLSSPAFADPVRRIAEKHGVPLDSIAAVLVFPDGTRWSHRGSAPMAPASNMKLVTAAAALDLLGPEFRFETDLWRTGTIRRGVLEGDLIVVGRGDPGISGRYSDGDPFGEVRRWSGLLQELGIERVAGRVRADDTYFEGPVRLEEWPRNQLHRWYCAPSGALNLNDNCVDVHIEPAADRQRIDVRLVPAIARFEVRNDIVPVRDVKRHLYRVDRAPGSWELVLQGRFLASGEERVEWITFPEPTEAFLAALQGMLAEAEIAVDGEASDSGRRVLVGRVVHTLSEHVPVLLKRSQNLYGDCFLKTIGKERGEGGSFASGAARVREWLAASIEDDSGVVIRDGSGLSQRNRLTAEALVALIGVAERKPWREHFFSGLAVAGRDGTLARRFRNSAVRDAVRAKTGHIAGVSALSGVLAIDAGECRFALLYHGRPAGVAKAERWMRGVLEAAAGGSGAGAADGSGKD